MKTGFNYSEMSLISLKVLLENMPPGVSEDRKAALEKAIKEKEQKKSATIWKTVNDLAINLN